MSIIKRAVAVLLIVLTVLSMGSCTPTNGTDEDQSIKIVCTVFPIYDWVKNIVSEMDPEKAQNLFGIEYEGRTKDIDLILLYDNGTDLHSYQATASDLVAIATCDLLIYVGGESDKWIQSALTNSANPNRRVLCLTEIIKDRLIQSDHDHNDHEGEEIDEHVWLSIKNAELFCDAIFETITEIDTENKALYAVNTGIYTEKLQSLDKYLSDIVADAPSKEVIFADRFPFSYLMEDYGITCHAAFDGCSSEAEASFDTIITLAATLNRLGAKAILTTESPLSNVADAVISAANTENIEVLAMNSMQSVSQKDMDEGKTYLSLMEENIAVLKAALN